MSNNPNPSQTDFGVDDEFDESTPQIYPSIDASPEVIRQLMEHAVRKATYRDKKRIYELEHKVADAEKMRCPYPGVAIMKKQLEDKDRQCKGLQETLIQKQSEIDRLNRLVFQLQTQARYYESAIRVMQGQVRQLFGFCYKVMTGDSVQGNNAPD
ncbi:hypothetical protein QCA50_013442 [Cerrena zonata]|uniref:Uncharacterized protein n=1 Tax=Cerrena zonata TaxID=2478898 RepID=A0AAW0FZK0_9APHY